MIYRLYGMMILSVCLVLVMAGCNTTTTTTLNSTYNVHNGKLTKCTLSSHPGNGNGDGVCTWPFYASSNSSDPTTDLYECSSYNGTCTPVTSNTFLTPTSQCIPHWVYDQLANKGVAWQILYQQVYTNGGTTTTDWTVTFSQSLTVTVTDEKQATSSLDAKDIDLIITTIALSVKQQVNHSVASAVQVTVTNSPRILVAPGTTAHAIYGVEVQKTSGHLYDSNKCESNWDFGMDLTYTPIASGWCSWIGDKSGACPSI